MTAPLAPAPETLFAADGRLRDGVYAGGVADPDLGVRGVLASLRQKEWHYVSACTQTHFVAVAVVQLGYVANAFAYAVPLADPGAEPWQFEAISPLGRAASFASAADRGLTRWQGQGAQIAITGDRNGWQLELDVTLRRAGAERVLRGTMAVSRAQALALVHTLPTGNPAYTEQEAGLQAELDLRLGDQPIAGAALATSDWTRSLAQRQTRWKWASLVARLPDGRRLGLNLSAEVYEDARGHGRENAVWIDGCVWPLGGVRFTVPADPARQAWHIHSATDDTVALRFEPMGARRQDVNFGAVSSWFIQPYGRFFGRLAVAGAVVVVDGAVGVVEDHRALW